MCSCTCLLYYEQTVACTWLLYYEQTVACTWLYCLCINVAMCGGQEQGHERYTAESASETGTRKNLCCF
jgi:hypothetical protein